MSMSTDLVTESRRLAFTELFEQTVINTMAAAAIASEEAAKALTAQYALLNLQVAGEAVRVLQELVELRKQSNK